MKTCVECGKDFNTSRYLRCSKCRKNRWKSAHAICSGCGEKCAWGSIKCWDCSNKNTQPTTLLLPGTHDTAWVAGYLDAEGSFLKKGKHGMTIKAESTDYDVIVKLQRLVGVGKICKPAKRGEHKQSWIWYTSASKYTGDVCRLLGPYLSDRRFQKIEEIISVQVDRDQEVENIVPYLAGFFEGDGSLSRNGNGLQLAVSCTDQDTIDKYYKTFGGYIRKTTKNDPYWKPLYHWRVTEKSEVERITNLLRPYLGTRRLHTLDTLVPKT